MRRRDFMALIAGSAAQPLAVRAQPAPGRRRLGVLMSLWADDWESQLRLAIFLQALQDLGWSAGRNLAVDIYWGDDNAERTGARAAELVALAPDVLLASGNTAAGPLHRATQTLPIVFVQVAEPLGEGLVASLARPGGNVTGFASIDYAMSGRWLELLKEISPGVTRVLVIRDPGTAAGTGQLSAIRSAAEPRGIALETVGVRDADEIARAITALANAPNGGLIVTTSTRASAHREQILAQTARLKLPAVYPFRFYAEAGGLLSYGANWTDQYRRAAGYVDRILKGEKPADLPVETPQTYELVINRKTAQSLGLELPASLLKRATDVIE